MALDAAMISITARTLANTVTGARIDKISMPSRDEAVLSVRTQEGSYRMLWSARPGSSRVQLTSEEYEYPAVPPSFCMLLRKHLNGGRITSVMSVPDERIVFFDIDALNEMGDRVTVRVSVELMGRYSNIVLINSSGIVIDAMKRIDEEQSEKRQLYPGVEFTLPPAQEKLSFSARTLGEICSAICRREQPLSSAILSCVSGIGPVVCREIACRVSPSDEPASALSPDKKARLEASVGFVQDQLNALPDRFYAVFDDAKPVEYSFIKLTQYGSLRTEEFASVFELFDRFYSERDRSERMKTRSADLSRQVNSLYERAVRKQHARMSERDNSGKANEKKLFGELITANLHMIQKGMKSVELFNYYTGENITVPLDVMKNPVQNSQKYYKDYRKLTTAAQVLERLLAEGQAEIEYLDAVKYEITEARTEEDFLMIRRELKDAGYLRGFKYKDQKRPRRMSEFTEYTSPGGFRVLAGRSNVSNEKLTLKTASKNDVWFHVKNAAGSHVVLFTEGSVPPDEDLTFAAEIAALHSSVVGSAQIPVDYTEIKNVKKPPETRTGMVTYDRYKTAFVTPDPERLKQFLKK